MKKIDLLYKWITESRNLIVITGAGISVPSGISAFRGREGMKLPFEKILSYGALECHKEEFNKVFFESLYKRDLKPNEAHYYLKRLEDLGILNAIITQNVDDFHQLAGSRKVYPIHGSAHSFFCMECGKKVKEEEILPGKMNFCECGGYLRPDITLYGEAPDETYYHLSQVAVEIADVILVIGSSMEVSTAGSLLNYYSGNKLVYINKEKTAFDKKADLVFHEDILKIVEELEEKEKSRM